MTSWRQLMSQNDVMMPNNISMAETTMTYTREVRQRWGILFCAYMTNRTSGQDKISGKPFLPDCKLCIEKKMYLVRWLGKVNIGHAVSIPNADQCKSIKIRFQELIQNLIIADQLYWSTLGSIPEGWSLLISIYQHWGLIWHVPLTIILNLL